jgi:hypothetical protein
VQFTVIIITLFLNVSSLYNSYWYYILNLYLQLQITPAKEVRTSVQSEISHRLITYNTVLLINGNKLYFIHYPDGHFRETKRINGTQPADTLSGSRWSYCFTFILTSKSRKAVQFVRLTTDWIAYIYS